MGDQEEKEQLMAMKVVERNSDAPATILSMYRLYLACILLLPIVWVKRREFIKLSKSEWLFLSIAGIF
jgi:hypothetical protein